jgi:hypothetical protein
MKAYKTIAGLLGVLLIGATAVFAWNGSGTGTGTLSSAGVDLPWHFHPFAEWSGHSSGSSFSGTWVDNNHHQSGTFSGNYYSLPPGPSSNCKRSEGNWYWNVDGRSILMGSYVMDLEINFWGWADGTWNTTNPNYQGSGTMTGDDPEIPPH